MHTVDPNIDLAKLSDQQKIALGQKMARSQFYNLFMSMMGTNVSTDEEKETDDASNENQMPISPEKNQMLSVPDALKKELDEEQTRLTKEWNDYQKDFVKFEHKLGYIALGDIEFKLTNGFLIITRRSSKWVQAIRLAHINTFYIDENNITFGTDDSDPSYVYNGFKENKKTKLDEYTIAITALLFNE